MGPIFNEMAGAVIDELEPDERSLLDTLVFTRIVAICAAVAERKILPPGAPRDLQPPPMHYIRAGLLIPGDYVWVPELTFEIIDSVTREYGDMVIVYGGGRTALHGPNDPIRVAVSSAQAAIWNQERSLMDDETVRSLHAAFGSF